MDSIFWNVALNHGYITERFVLFPQQRCLPLAAMAFFFQRGREPG